MLIYLPGPRMGGRVGSRCCVHPPPIYHFSVLLCRPLLPLSQMLSCVSPCSALSIFLLFHPSLSTPPVCTYLTFLSFSLTPRRVWGRALLPPLVCVCARGSPSQEQGEGVTSETPPQPQAQEHRSPSPTP